MLGGYIGQGIGVSLRREDTGIVEGTFAVAGTSAAAPVGASTQEAAFAVAGQAATGLVPGQTIGATFAVAGVATIDARSFTDIAEGAVVVAGQARVNLAGGFGVPKIADIVYSATAGSGRRTVSGGSGRATIGQ